LEQKVLDVFAMFLQASGMEANIHGDARHRNMRFCGLAFSEEAVDENVLNVRDGEIKTRYGQAS
jgi:hypothetical protein